jgi:hypothetical protein
MNEYGKDSPRLHIPQTGKMKLKNILNYILTISVLSTSAPLSKRRATVSVYPPSAANISEDIPY